MLTIITGNDIPKVWELSVWDKNKRAKKFYDDHPKWIIDRAEELVKKHGHTKSEIRVMTFNITAIQALFYFSRKYNKPKPKCLFCTDGKVEEVSNNMEVVYSDLVALTDILYELKME